MKKIMSEACLSEKILDSSDSPGFWKSLVLWLEPRRGSVCSCGILEAFQKTYCQAAKQAVDFTTVWFWKFLEVCSKLEGGALGVLPECQFLWWCILLRFKLGKWAFLCFWNRLFSKWTWPCWFRWSLLGRVRQKCLHKNNRMTSKSNKWLVAGQMEL